MNTKLRLALYAQVIFFALWAAWCMSNFNNAPAIWLSTEPVDPRDLISGKYVQLRYQANNLEKLNCPAGGNTLYVRLDPAAEDTPTAKGPVRLHEAKACAAAPEGEGIWVKAQHSRYHRGRVTYGIEKFYLNENDPLLNARSGTLAVRAAIGRDRRLRALELARKTDAGGNITP